MLSFFSFRHNLVLSHSRLSFRLVHNSGQATRLRHRDWGVVGHFSRPSPLSEAEPDGEDDEKKARRYQTANHTPESDPTPLRWAQHRATMKAKFPNGWAPPHKLSRAAMDGLRALHAHDPDTFTTPVLSEKFRISPEAVRRILRSKWQPTKEQHARLLQRERRHRYNRTSGILTEGESKRKKVVHQR
jgi:Neugrin